MTRVMTDEDDAEQAAQADAEVPRDDHANALAWGGAAAAGDDGVSVGGARAGGVGTGGDATPPLRTRAGGAGIVGDVMMTPGAGMGPRLPRGWADPREGIVALGGMARPSQRNLGNGMLVMLWEGESYDTDHYPCRVIDAGTGGQQVTFEYLYGHAPASGETYVSKDLEEETYMVFEMPMKAHAEGGGGQGRRTREPAGSGAAGAGSSGAAGSGAAGAGAVGADVHVTPGRKRIRDDCASAQEQQGLRMQRRAARKGAHNRLVCGNIVQVGIANVDRGRADGTVLTCVVVEVTQTEMYRVATQAGVLKDCYSRGHLFQITTGTLRGLNLEGAYNGWRLAPRISMREAARAASFTGGQGMVKCQCVRGTCLTNKCHCYKNNRQCNSRCHPRNSQCSNCG